MRTTQKFHPAAGRCRRIGVGGSGGVAIGCAIALWLGADDASAAAVGGVGGTSLGLLAAIVTWLLLRAWQLHLGTAGLSTLGGLAALAVGVVLLWRGTGVGGWRSLLRMSGALPGRLGATPAAPTWQTTAPSLPPGVDRIRLMADLRRHFFDLQGAWDLGARDRLGVLTTPDMLEELCAARSAGAQTPSRSEVLRLETHLLLFEERDSAQVVCVEFSGMVRESAWADASPFREFWMLTRARYGASGWRLARHQALL